MTIRPSAQQHSLKWILLGAALLRLAVLAGALAAALSVQDRQPGLPDETKPAEPGAVWQWFWEPDTDSYLAPARKLWSEGRFAVGDEAEIIRTPGYPLLLLPGIAVGAVEPITLLLQFGLSLWTVYVVVRLAAEHSHAAACAAGILAAIEPLGLTYPARLTSETLFTALVATAVWQLGSRAGSSARSTIVGALCVAAAALVRPIAYGLPLAIAAGMLAEGRPRGAAHVGSRWARFWPAGVLVAVAMVVFGSWQLRNERLAGYAGFSAIGDVNRYFYQGAGVLAAREHRSFYEVQNDLGYHDSLRFAELHPEQREWTTARQMQWLRTEGNRLIAKAPRYLIQQHLAGMARVLVDPGSIELLKLWNAYPPAGGLLGQAVDRGIFSAAAQLVRARPGVAALTVMFGMLLVVQWMLAARGWWAEHVAGRTRWLWLAVIVYLVLASGGPQAVARFRHPIMPFVCACAGIGWSAVLAARRQRIGQSNVAK